MLKESLQRFIMRVDPLPSSVELSENTLRALLLECGFDPPKPPEKLPDGYEFWGVKLVKDEGVPDGTFRLTVK